MEPAGETASHHTRTFSARAGRFVIGVCVLACLFALGHLAQQVNSAFHSEAGRYDFSSYYAAAAALRTDPHANIYTQAVLDRVGASAHLLVNPPLPYTYPPLFAILLSPFTVVSFRLLSRAWLALNFTLWLAIVPILAVEIYHLLAPAISFAPARPVPPATVGRPRRVLDDPVAWFAMALAAWLVLLSWPAAQTMSTGQVNFLVLLPLALVPLLTRLRRERWVGVAIAFAAMLKFTPALLIGYLALRRRWDALIASLVALVALAVLSAVDVGPHNLLAAIPQALRVGGGDAGLGHNQALLAPLLHALSASPSSALSVAAKAITGLAAVALALWLFRPAAANPSESLHDTDRENLGYALALCAMVLISPAAWVHHYIWILPAAALALGMALRDLLAARDVVGQRRGLIECVVVVVACLGLSLALPAGWDTEPSPATHTYLGLHLWPILLEMRPLATLLLVGLLCAWYARAAFSGEAEPRPANT
jgi:alpha-1,2-mannosyltransferase